MKLAKGLVSCIIPTYNRKDFLESVLTQLKNQTYQNLEIIVVNDGSNYKIETLPKNLLDIIDVCIELPFNSGSVSIPRGIGVSYANGEFIAPIDDDIIHEQNKIDLLIRSAQSSNAKLIYGDMRIFKYGHLSDIITKPQWNPLEPNGWGVDNSQFIYRTDVYQKISIKFPKRACDWEIGKQIQTAFPYTTFKHVPCVVSNYIWHNANRSHDDSTKTNLIYPNKFKQYFNPKWENEIDFNQ
jgi:glycosyltransferase involved in cell wall biosynthesis